jgi:2',3'-cyclic-nucleotide 2'-phosphodiesterase (5'-nucleotidase family)
MTGLGISSGVPAVAGSLQGDAKHLKSIQKSQAIRKQKAHQITLLYTADIHSQLLTHDEFFIENNKIVYKKRGGFAVLKTMLQTLKSENPENTLVIDAGDCFQGGGVASLSKGASIVPLINNIGYDLVLPGNWEVAYGKEMMWKDLGAYHAQKICANMYHDTTDELKGELIFQPYWTKIIGGIKIGFIGYNDPLTPKRQSPAYSVGIRFAKPEANVAKYIRILKDYEKCQMVFLVTHMGLTQQVDLGNQSYVDGVDFILGADTHERIRKPIQAKYAKVVEPGSFGSFVGRLDFVIEKGVVKDYNYELLDVAPEKYKPNKEMEMLVDAAYEPFKAELGKVIGYSKTPLLRYYVLETPIDNLITDAIMEKFKPDIALSNGFRFCPPLVPDTKTGLATLTNDFLWSMFPVDSEAKQAQITGKQLWNWLEKELNNVFAKNPAQRFGGWLVRFQGMKINFTAGNEMGQRLNWVRVGDSPIDLAKTYTVVACEREGDPDNVICRIEGVSNPKKLGGYLHDAIRDYLGRHSPISPMLEGRASATDLPNTLLSQLEGYDYQFM